MTTHVSTASTLWFPRAGRAAPVESGSGRARSGCGGIDLVPR